MLTNALAAQTIRDVIAHRFKDEDFAGGFAAGTNAVMLAIKGDYVGNPAGVGGAGAGGGATGSY